MHFFFANFASINTHHALLLFSHYQIHVFSPQHWVFSFLPCRIANVLVSNKSVVSSCCLGLHSSEASQSWLRSSMPVFCPYTSCGVPSPSSSKRPLKSPSLIIVHHQHPVHNEPRIISRTDYNLLKTCHQFVQISNFRNACQVSQCPSVRLTDYTHHWNVTNVARTSGQDCEAHVSFCPPFPIPRLPSSLPFSTEIR